MTILSENVRKIKPGTISLLISDAQDIMTNNLNLLKNFLKKDRVGVYITINQPFFSLEKQLEANKIKIDNLFFIDLISSTVSLRSEKTEKCLFINSPSSLTELGIAIEQLITTIEGKEKFLIIDNIAALLIYNSTDVTSKFAHFIINKMRVNNITGIIMTIEEEETGKGLIDTISSFCDNVIKIK